jgi:hypothetical protein
MSADKQVDTEPNCDTFSNATFYSTAQRAIGALFVLAALTASWAASRLLWGEWMASSVAAHGTTLFAGGGRRLSALVTLTVSALWLGTLGLGVIGGRRWGRSLSLTSAWVALIDGVLTLPDLATTGYMQYMIHVQDSGWSVMKSLATEIVVLLPMVALVTVVPGALIYFFSRGEPVAARERTDPSTSWTERLPLPVLGLGLAVVYTGLSVLIQGVQQNWVCSVFGLVLVGGAAEAIIIGVFTLCCLCAWRLWKLYRDAWWATLWISILLPLSFAVTLTCGRYDDLLRYAYTGIEQNEISKALMASAGCRTLIHVFGAGVIGVLYLLHVRQYYWIGFKDKVGGRK